MNRSVPIVPDADRASDPEPDCPLCPRLVEFRTQYRNSDPDWHNAPVASFGKANAQLLIVGLAPGLRGANRTGRPFTGDYAGDLLYATLHEYGFATDAYAARPDDGLRLSNCRITNAVRCVPPQNKPTSQEIKACRPFLVSTMRSMPKLKVMLALGRIAHESVLRTLDLRLADFPFAHRAHHEIQNHDWNLHLVDSYHCSRYNTNTGRLTEAMFHQVFDTIAEIIN